MNRVSLKIVGASGQGIDSVGEILAKALKRSGYCVFGYREYPSLIKGGHASYQLDISNEKVESTETHVNILICFNHHGLEINLPDLKPGGIVIHSTPLWKFSGEQTKLIEKKGLKVIELPIEKILAELNAKAILANVILAASVWAILGQDKEPLKKMVGERFAKKKDLLDLNMQCIEKGYSYSDATHGKLTVAMPKANAKWKKCMLLTGSKAMGMGAVHAGVRVYAGYPMTPSSPLLSYIASVQNQTGMTIKQAEDEITAAQIVSGAMLVGTRALTATSGGGFDLMSETVSLNGIIENPTVFVLAQRPGPATGLPTWTAQGDLLMACFTAHGEFARCVMSVADSQDAFDLMNDAFNIAEQYQTPVIVLTDKQIAEALYTQEPYNQKKAKISRGNLVTDAKALAKLKGSDRYDPTAKDGISPRWLPGSKAATFCSQGDEHNGDGTVDEGAKNAQEQLEKRMRKMEAMKKNLPEPEIYQALSGELRAVSKVEPTDLLIVGWGSTKSVVLDVLKEFAQDSKLKARISYLHYTYLWPLKTDALKELMKKAKKTVMVEGNGTGQLAQLLKMEAGIDMPKILKYDGRPFFYDELRDLLSKAL